MSRKPPRTAERVAALGEAMAHIAAGASVRAAAAAVDVPRATVGRHVRRIAPHIDPEQVIAERARAALERLVARVERELDSTESRNMAPWIREMRDTASLLLGWRERAAEREGAQTHSALAALLARSGARVSVTVESGDAPIDVTPRGVTDDTPNSDTEQ